MDTCRQVCKLVARIVVPSTAFLELHMGRQDCPGLQAAGSITRIHSGPLYELLLVCDNFLYALGSLVYKKICAITRVFEPTAGSGRLL